MLAQNAVKQHSVGFASFFGKYKKNISPLIAKIENKSADPRTREMEGNCLTEEPRIDRVKRFSKIWWQSRADMQKSQEFMALSLGVSKKTIQN